jgi:hypothetical protein
MLSQMTLNEPVKSKFLHPLAFHLHEGSKIKIRYDTQALKDRPFSFSDHRARNLSESVVRLSNCGVLKQSFPFIPDPIKDLLVTLKVLKFFKDMDLELGKTCVKTEK